MLCDMIRRIQEMERIFDSLRRAVPGDASMLPQLRQLIEYYEGPLWRHDYEADENGLLPSNLKRGVLSQDGVYDLLTDWCSGE